MKKKVLVVDDDPDDRELVISAFLDLNELHFVYTACDGHEALQKLTAKEDLPDVIMLDLNMPRMSGFEVLKRLKQDPQLKHIPVVIFTTSTSKKDIDQSYSLGALKFITKPAHYKQLIDSLESIIKMITISNEQ